MICGAGGLAPDGGTKFPAAQFLSRPYCVRVMVQKRAQSASLCGTWNVDEPVPPPGEPLRFQKEATAFWEPWYQSSPYMSGIVRGPPQSFAPAGGFM